MVSVRSSESELAKALDSERLCQIRCIVCFYLPLLFNDFSVLQGNRNSEGCSEKGVACDDLDALLIHEHVYSPCDRLKDICYLLVLLVGYLQVEGSKECVKKVYFNLSPYLCLT
jgi:hypothetical protein